jgi:ketosteroid isomerase-like protein
MPEADPETVAIQFVNKINRQDIAAMTAMMDPDILFVDSLGQKVRGADRLRAGYVAYFALFPDYRITVRQHFRQRGVVVLLGSARGTLAKDGKMPRRNHWAMPAVWRAAVRNGRVAHWQVYADNTPVAKLLSARSG